MRREFARARAVAWKDLRTERRTMANFNAVLFLAVVLICMALCLGGFFRVRRHGKPGWCCGPGTGGRDEECSNGRK